MEVNRVCPACNSRNYILEFNIPASLFCNINSTYRTDYAEILHIDPDTTYPIVRCRECRFVYAGHLPTEKFLSTVYDKVIDTNVGAYESLRPERVANQLWNGTILLNHINMIWTDEKQLNILDFGCGFGTIVKAFNGPRIKCIGYETSNLRINYMKKTNLPVISTEDEVISHAPYHGIIMNDVLEHVPEPRKTIAFFRKLLLRNGILSISVPDFNDSRLNLLARQVRNKTLQARDLNPWEHLNYFSPSTLFNMIKHEGLTPYNPCIHYKISSERNSIKTKLQYILKEIKTVIKKTVYNNPQTTLAHAKRTD